MLTGEKQVSPSSVGNLVRFHTTAIKTTTSDTRAYEFRPYYYKLDCDSITYVGF